MRIRWARLATCVIHGRFYVGQFPWREQWKLHDGVNGPFTGRGEVLSPSSSSGRTITPSQIGPVGRFGLWLFENKPPAGDPIVLVRFQRPDQDCVIVVSCDREPVADWMEPPPWWPRIEDPEELRLAFQVLES